MTAYEPSPRSRVRRLYARGSYDHDAVYAILDVGFICHVGYVIDGQPYVTPTSYWREGNRLYWHGSSASRMLRTVKEGIPACLTATHVDGLVLARTGFHHSVNYRSVMAFGNARPVGDEAEKAAVLKNFMDSLIPGRWEALRPPNEQELKATTVVWMDIEEASAKVRTGPPIDDEEDYELPIWAGVIPISTRIHAPEPDPRLARGISVPENLKTFSVG